MVLLKLLSLICSSRVCLSAGSAIFDFKATLLQRQESGKRHSHLVSSSNCPSAPVAVAGRAGDVINSHAKLTNPATCYAPKPELLPMPLPQESLKIC